MNNQLMGSLLFISILTLSQIIGWQWYKIKKLKKTPPAVPTIDAQKMLAAISSGEAILRIQVIDPGEIFLRSPRT